MAIKLKRGLEATIPTLQEGEPGFTTDSKKLFVGSDAGNIEIGTLIDGITADEVDYDNSTSGLVADKVQGAIDEVVVELNTLENKVDLTNIKQDIRINEIEELARKSASGETSDNVLGTDIIPLKKNTANAPMSVKVDGGILEAPNLVVNGDFSAGSSGFNLMGASYLTFNNNTLLMKKDLGAGVRDVGVYQDKIANVNDLFYFNVRYKNSSTTTGISLRQFDYNSFADVVTILTVTTPGAISTPDFVNKSTLFTNNKTNFRLALFIYLTPENSIHTEFDYIYMFNVSTMKLKGVKNDNGILFSNLTNEQIKTQIDLWGSKGIIPNDNLLSVNMNKRVRSVGKNLFDKSTVVIGKYLSASNTVVTDASFSYSDFISVKPSTQYIKDVGGDNLFYDINKNFILYTVGNAFTTPSNCYYIRLNRAISGLNTFQLELGSVATSYTPYVHSDLYLQANTKGYSLPNGVKDTIEYRNGKYYFVKRVDDADLNNLVELSPYVETEIEAWGNLQGYESGVVYVDDIKIDASIYNSGITTTSEIKALDEIVKITNGVETQLDTSLAVIAVDKLSFTHPDLVDGDYVWFAYEEDGNYYKATTNITYYIDKLVRTSPDGSVWKLDWSVDNSGVITWTPTKI